jgi:hypothetical protein
MKSKTVLTEYSCSDITKNKTKQKKNIYIKNKNKINQSINQSINQAINQSFNQSKSKERIHCWVLFVLNTFCTFFLHRRYVPIAVVCFFFAGCLGEFKQAKCFGN